MSKTLLRFAATFALLASLISLASAQQQNRIYREGGNWAEEITGSLTPAKNLRVKVDVGSVRIVGGPQPVINYVIRAAKGKINAESGGGSVVLISGLQGAVLETGGGSIEVKKCTGSVKATTGGGSIDLGDIGGPAEIETGGGSIRLGSAKGFVHADTGGGSIELNGVPGARAETGAGGIIAKFIASTGERTDSVLETSAGDITVFLAADLAITIRASVELANGHQIRSDFSDIHVTTEGGEYGPKTVTAEGRLNGGGPV